MWVSRRVLCTGGVAAAVALTTASSVRGRSTTARCVTFADGHRAHVTYRVCGPILARYRAEGGPAGDLGLPVSDERAVRLEPVRRFADREVTFEGGTIYLNCATGTTELGRWYAYTPLKSEQR